MHILQQTRQKTRQTVLSTSSRRTEESRGPRANRLRPTVQRSTNPPSTHLKTHTSLLPYSSSPKISSSENSSSSTTGASFPSHAATVLIVMAFPSGAVASLPVVSPVVFVCVCLQAGK